MSEVIDEDDTKKTRVSEDDCLFSEDLDVDVLDSLVLWHPSQADMYWATE